MSSIGWFPKKLERWLIENEDTSLTIFLVVLCSLSFFIMPLMHVSDLEEVWVTVVYSLLFLAAAFTGGLTGLWRTLAFMLASSSIFTTWMRDVNGGEGWTAASLISSIAFMAFVCYQLNLEVFRPGEINGHRIRGAIAIYVIIGFIFAMVYSLVELLAPGSFSGLGPDGFGKGLEKSVYFSFVTLTTLGFGDTVPISVVARNLAVVEAIIGQLYLTILIGRLISLHGPPADPEADSDEAVGR